MDYEIRLMDQFDIDQVVLGEEKVFGESLGYDMLYSELVMNPFANYFVLDIDGNVIANLSGDENREIVTISEMSKYLPEAFISIEDKRFYDHHGVDIIRIFGALFKNIKNILLNDGFLEENFKI